MYREQSREWHSRHIAWDSREQMYAWESCTMGSKNNPLMRADQIQTLTPSNTVCPEPAGDYESLYHESE